MGDSCMAHRKKAYVLGKKKPKGHRRAFVLSMLVVACILVGVATVAALTDEKDNGSIVEESLTPEGIMEDWQIHQVSSSAQSRVEFSSSSSSSLSPESEDQLFSSAPESRADADGQYQQTGGNPPAETGADATHDQPVPESAAVDRSYFDDALFIGDSRSEGFKLYSELDNATYYVYKGLSVETVGSKAVINAPDGTRQTVMNALKQKQFGKVYIMLGINELGWSSTDIFIQKYAALVEAVKQYNPNAVVYVQSILPVSKKKAGDPVYNNENVNRFNGLIQEMVKQQGVYYVNPAEAVMVDGMLADEASADGVHLNKKYCLIWRDYLATHTVKQ